MQTELIIKDIVKFYNICLNNYLYPESSSQTVLSLIKEHEHQLKYLTDFQKVKEIETIAASYTTEP